MNAPSPDAAAPFGLTVLRPRVGEAARAVVIVVCLGLAVGIRVGMNGPGVTTAIGAGAVFGCVLVVLARTSGWRPGWPGLEPLGLGVVGGAMLVVLPGLTSVLPPIQGGVHAEPFAAWAVVTVVVALGEEAVLRGALFDAVAAAAGRPAAVALTSLAFALIHVPLYGWHVIGLDLAVGIALAGLRLVSRGVAAPAVAHIMADLATWWM